MDASRISALHGKTAAREDLSFSYPNFADLRAARADGVEDLVAFRGVAMNLSYAREPRRVWGEMVSPNFLDLLHVRPLHGRGFFEAEGSTKGDSPASCVSWSRRDCGSS